MSLSKNNSSITIMQNDINIDTPNTINGCIIAHQDLLQHRSFQVQASL